MNKDRFLQRRVEHDYTGGCRGVFDHSSNCCIKFKFEKDVDPEPYNEPFLEITIDTGHSAEIIADIDGTEFYRPDRIRLRFARRDEQRAAVDFFKFMIASLEECD